MTTKVVRNVLLRMASTSQGVRVMVGKIVTDHGLLTSMRMMVLLEAREL